VSDCSRMPSCVYLRVGALFTTVSSCMLSCLQGGDCLDAANLERECAGAGAHVGALRLQLPHADRRARAGLFGAAAHAGVSAWSPGPILSCFVFLSGCVLNLAAVTA